MGRQGTRLTSSVHEICVIGEQLRKQMHEQGLIRDRRHHLRKHKQCFVGRDVVDWLMKMCHVQTRDQAVAAMQILEQHGLYHHATDEQEFKDQNFLYRFCYDDETYKLNKDLYSFYRGLDVYHKIKSSSNDVMQEFYLKGSLYTDAFYGCDLVDLIVVSEGVPDRDNVIQEMRDLLERDIIKHVTDDYHFSDDKLIYEFTIDFDKPCLLQDVLHITSHRMMTGSLSRFEEIKEYNEKVVGQLISVSTMAASPDFSLPASHDPSLPGMTGDLGDPRSSFKGINDTTKYVDISKVKPVVPYSRTMEELENSTSSSITSCLRMTRDAAGYGLVLAGSDPCYVRTVDPHGPAASAGLKVHQFLASVNNVNVLRMDHQTVGQIMNQSHQATIVVQT